MWARLGEAMRELSGDEGLRCVVVRGAGEKAFAAGADIAEFARERADSRQAKPYGELIHETMQAVARCRHPTVALIRGACVGGGLEIAAMCDLRICGQSSRFGIPVNRLGLTMAYGELMGLLALVAAPPPWRSCSRAACSTPTRPCARGWSTASCPTTSWKKKPPPPSAGSPMARRSSTAGTSNSSSALPCAPS